MLKLLRNTLSDGGKFVDNKNEKIKWEYIAELEKLHLANKVTKTHVNFPTQKMKVSQAAQTFSASVASAIEFCATTLKLNQFQGSESKVKFL